MSRKRIVAATMTAAALGLAFAGYTATRANGTEEMPRHARPLPVSADAGYRQNHQVGHNGAVFEWMDAAASLDGSTDLHAAHHEDPVTGKDLVAGTEEADLEPVALEHASRVGLNGWAGFGLAGGGGGSQKGADEWGGGHYAGNFAFGFGGGIGSFGGGGGAGGNGSKGTSGTNDPAGDKPHQDAPAGSNDNKDEKPGTNDPKDQPPVTGPSTLNPGPDEHTPGGPNGPTGPTGPNPGGDHPPPGGAHDVPEPATLGLLGFGMIAAAALRRRRRS